MSINSQRRRRTRRRLPIPVLLVGAVLFLAVVIWTALLLFRAVQQIAAEFDMVDPDFVVSEPAVEGGGAPDGSTLLPAPTSVAAPLIARDALAPWSGTERVNVLLLGIDQRCDEVGPTRTDSMLVLTVDPVGLSAAALSLPRDLWVEIPGFGVDRISQAHYIGDVREYPGGGIGLAVETVEATLGIELDYYAAINFDAFIDFIDLIGGITIDVAETIDDPDYPDSCYGIDPFFLDPGIITMNGPTALKYARTRSTLGGDVDRALRQQQVGLAIRDQLLTADRLPQLIARAPQLWQTFQSNVRTNMTPTEAIQLALLAQDIPRGQIRTAVIDFNYVYLDTTPDGDEVLVPLRDNIRALRDELFAPPTVPTPSVDNLLALVGTEDARVALLNGTPIFGLAGRTETFLTDKGINVTEIGNADAATYPSTRIIDYGSHPNTTLFLSQLMSVPPLNINNGTAPDGDYDVLIILGNDWDVPDP